ncbi:hypothetical protein BH10PLA2_BH10PLA2_19830 [soil metagenome]
MIATNRTRSSLRLCLGMTCLLVVMTARAEERTERVIIHDVISTGNLHVLTPQIVKMIKSKAGAEFKQDILDEDVRTLLQSKQFQDVQVQQQPMVGNKIRLYFRITEIPTTIQDIVFNGNKQFKADALRKITGLQKGQPLRFPEVQKARLALLQHYRKVGREYATVEILEGDKQADERVIFSITEGEHVSYGYLIHPKSEETKQNDGEFSDVLAYTRVQICLADGSDEYRIRELNAFPHVGQELICKLVDSGNFLTRDHVTLRIILPRVPIPFPIL